MTKNKKRVRKRNKTKKMKIKNCQKPCLQIRKKNYLKRLETLIKKTKKNY